MDSEDEMSNTSANNLNNRSGRHMHYDDIDEYLDEAMDSDEDADEDEHGVKRSVSKLLTHKIKSFDRCCKTHFFAVHLCSFDV